MTYAPRPIPHSELKLLIFDLDGTLIDSQLDLCHSVNAMLRQHRRAELPCEVIANYVGDGAPMLVRRALGDPDDEHLVRDALAYFLAYYRAHKLDNTYAYAGVPEMLQAVGDSGRRKLAVLSNKPVVPSRQILEALGLSRHFVQIYGGNSFHSKKPDPEGVLALLRESSAEPGQAVIIGDSDVDVLTGRNAGLWTVGVSYGFAPHTLEAAPPDLMVHSPQELAEALGA